MAGVTAVSTISLDKITAGDWVLEMTPAQGVVKGAIIALHGRGSTFREWQGGGDGGNKTRTLAPQLAAWGRAVISIDAGGPVTWGINTAQDAITAAVAYAKATYGVTKVGLLGHSMGGQNALIWVRNHPADVAAAWVFAPVVDLQAMHDRSPTFASDLETVWGGAGSWYANSAVRDPIRVAASIGAANRPIHIAYGTADPTVPPADVETFAAAAGSNISLQSLAGADHANTIFGAVQPAELAAFFEQYGA